jgi:uncharacterized protein (TIGR02145 family)
MVKQVLLSVFLSLPALFQAQELSMTFSSSGQVDSVTATNLRTTGKVTLPGSETLVLNYVAGIPVIPGTDRGCALFPNPFPGSATFSVTLASPHAVDVTVHNMSGQLVAGTKASLAAGRHCFRLTVSKPGVYLVSMNNGGKTVSCKAVCAETTAPENRVSPAASPGGETGNPALKESLVYSLDYTPGDIILYRCRGGVHTTIITDVPSASKNYLVEFSPCADPDGKNYAVVKIGDLTWMAENLAWLPDISKSDTGSEFNKHYYVYGCKDSTVAGAKGTVNYRSYGVLYNYPAAMNTSGKKHALRAVEKGACPVGWHLPTDDEWKLLEKSLGMSQADADTLYLRHSGPAGLKLKATTTWEVDSAGSNLSGFSAIPGGYWNLHGEFLNIGHNALFWSATLSDTLAWYRSLSYNDQGVYRLKTLRSQGLSVRCVRDH